MAMSNRSNRKNDCFISIMKSGRSEPDHSRREYTSIDMMNRSGSPDVPGLSAVGIQSETVLVK